LFSIQLFSLIFLLRTSLLFRRICRVHTIIILHSFSDSPLLDKYFVFFFIALSLSFFAFSFINLFPSVYLVSQWPRSIKTLRSFVSNFAVHCTSFLRRPSHLPCISLSLIWSRCHLATFSPFILFQVVACTVVIRSLFTSSSSLFSTDLRVLSKKCNFFRSSSFVCVLSFLDYFYVFSLAPCTFFHHWHYGFWFSYVYNVLFSTFILSPYAILRFANAYLNKKKEVLQAKIAITKETSIFEKQFSAAFKIIYVIDIKSYFSYVNIYTGCPKPPVHPF